MELRIDRLLRHLLERPDDVLALIDTDPLLIRRQIGELVLANASKELFTPQLPHQLFAKGIVYRRNPYRLVSLPLLKIYNLGEREVTVHDLTRLIQPETRVHFHRKFDGTMIQRFEHHGQVFFTTRGMIEGAPLPLEDSADEDAIPGKVLFDYLGEARRIARTRYPHLVESHPELSEVTLILELIHPESRVITDYGDREDLVLLTVFDRQRHAYWPHARVVQLARDLQLTVADGYEPTGQSLSEQIDSLLTSLSESDEEGTVLAFEYAEEVIYRVKIKSPTYLRLLKMMVHCTYPATAEMLESFSEVPDWPEFKAFLQAKGSDQVPEEVLEIYHEHYVRYCEYLSQCRRWVEWSNRRSQAIRATITEADPRLMRKLYAERVAGNPFAALLFAGFDGRASLSRVREFFRDRDELLYSECP